MNVRTNYPFDAGAVRRFKYENAVFVVFLTENPFFRQTYPEPVPEAIVFLPSDAACQRAPLAVGQKTVVPHHFKMPHRNMADVTPQP
ncbi:hypothetical protein [Candidatus Erwinia dacicola]|uniref:hypothetical protein n=1 Tax=Candidatus Erwinia dacicola TaxID=252393 RepID=UPI001650482E|nr:hypothetical protein [Candidatus Erwinia dacicola]